MKLLVLNADDFGRDPAVNAAIAQAHTAGLLTSASLLVTAPDATAALEIARQHPRLSVGLHLGLVDSRPAAPSAKIQPLIDANGNLPAGPIALSWILRFRRETETAIETEVRAQFDRFLASGLSPTHVDTHMHCHLDPRVLRLVARLAREYHVPYLRTTVEPWRPALAGGRQRVARKLARWLAFGLFGRYGRCQVRCAGLRTADRGFGALDPGHVTEEFLIACLRRLPDGLTEIFCHPAAATTVALDQSQPGYEHVAELRALCSAQVRRLIEQQDIRLTNFRDLAAGG